jgi:hypothetical protein
VCALTETAPAAGQPADSVLGQQPAAGTSLVPGDTVTLTYAPTAIVPALGGAVDAACGTLAALNLGCTPQAGGPGSPAGQVVAQNHPAGTALAAGQAVVVTHTRQPIVPSVIGMNQAAACQTLANELLSCTWEVNPTNSVRNPGLADAQSIPPGTAVNGGVVAVYHPGGPDAVLARFRARRNGQLIEQWALAPTAGPGASVHAELTGRSDVWPADGGNAGRCYSTQVQGSIPLYDFMRRSADPNHQDHFYAAGGPGDAQYDRGVQYYSGDFPAPYRLLCYVAPGGSGAAQVTEWWKGSDGHFYTASEGPPAGGYTAVAQWTTW